MKQRSSAESKKSSFERLRRESKLIFQESGVGILGSTYALKESVVINLSLCSFFKTVFSIEHLSEKRA